MKIENRSLDSLIPHGERHASLSERLRLTLRCAGDMGPAMAHSEARTQFCAQLGVDPAALFMVNQVHGRRVVDVSVDGVPNSSVEADGIVFDADRQFAAVTVADCMPIFISDSEGPIAAIVHSGWKGTGIVVEAISILRDVHGISPRRLQVILGPGISVERYAVPAERATTFAESFGRQSVEKRDGRWFLDMKSANIALLSRCGVRSVVTVDACTAGDPRLSSYRRDGAADFVRMLAIAGQFRR